MSEKVKINPPVEKVTVKANDDGSEVLFSNGAKLKGGEVVESYISNCLEFVSNGGLSLVVFDKDGTLLYADPCTFDKIYGVDIVSQLIALPDTKMLLVTGSRRQSKIEVYNGSLSFMVKGDVRIGVHDSPLNNILNLARHFSYHRRHANLTFDRNTACKAVEDYEHFRLAIEEDKNDFFVKGAVNDLYLRDQAYRFIYILLSGVMLDDMDVHHINGLNGICPHCLENFNPLCKKHALRYDQRYINLIHLDSSRHRALSNRVRYFVAMRKQLLGC